MSRASVVVGIDVSKAALDVAVRPSGTAWRTGNDAAGITALVAELAALAPACVVLEATGGLERPATAALAAAGVPVAVVNPRPPADPDGVAVVTAGTADLPVAEEAALTAGALGSGITMVCDVGVAGAHRLVAQLYQPTQLRAAERLRRAGQRQ